MRILTLIFAILFTQSLSSQESKVTEDLFFYGDVMLNAIEYQNRAKAGDIFYSTFLNLINEGNAFDLAQDDIKTISILEDENGAFKLVSWQVRYLENQSKYYGFVLFPDGKYIELKDNADFTRDLEYEYVTSESWYGALYYSIKKVEEDKYLVFGFNQIDRFKNAKILDVIYIKDGIVSFGDEIFEDKKDLDTYQNRIVITYSTDANVNLNYNPGLEMIVHDHLIQRMGQLEGQGPINVPDGTYEGYKLVDGKWMYEEKLYNHSYGENNAPRPKPVLGKKKNLFGK